MEKIWAIDNELYRSLGKQVRQIRNEKRMPLRELSEKTGIPRSTLNTLELGIVRMKEPYWEKIAPVLGIKKDLEVSVKIVMEND